MDFAADDRKILDGETGYIFLVVIKIIDDIRFIIIYRVRGNGQTPDFYRIRVQAHLTIDDTGVTFDVDRHFLGDDAGFFHGIQHFFHRAGVNAVSRAVFVQVIHHQHGSYFSGAVRVDPQLKIF